MDKYSKIKDFFIESIQVNLRILFSFNCMKELENERFVSDVLDNIFIQRIPIINQIIRSNAVDDCIDLIYSFTHEKMTEINETIEKMQWNSNDSFSSAKINAIKFKIASCVTMMGINYTKGPDLRDQLKEYITEYFYEGNLESLEQFLLGFIIKIEGVEKCFDKIKQVLEITKIDKRIIDRFFDGLCKKKAIFNKFSIPVINGCIGNDDCNGMNNTFLSRKRHGPKINETDINNDALIDTNDKVKNKTIDEYFIKKTTITEDVKNLNSNESNTIKKEEIHVEKITLSKEPKKIKEPKQVLNKTKQSKKKIPKNNDDDGDDNDNNNDDDIERSRASQLINSLGFATAREYNTLISSSYQNKHNLMNSFQKSTGAYSNSFGTFDVSSFHNSDFGSKDKSIISTSGYQRGINSRLESFPSNVISLKKKKKSKKFQLAERLIEKCYFPDRKPKEDKPKVITQQMKIRQMLQRNFYSNSNNTSNANSRENSNNIPWNLSGNIDNNSNQQSTAETRNNTDIKSVIKEKKEKKDNENSDDSDDEILAYKTPEKGRCKNFDGKIDTIALRKNLYALFTQNIK